MRCEPVVVVFLAGALVSFAADAQGQEAVRLTSHPAYDYHPKWSPDGERILFTSQRDGRTSIWEIGWPEGDPVEKKTGLDGDHHISWSPDGTRIAFDARSSNGRLTLWTIDAAGGDPRPIPGVGTSCAHPSWSPDGRAIAYTAFTATGSSIFVVSLETGVATRLTNGGADDHHPIWTHDARKLLFASDRNGDYDLWSIDLATKKLTCLYQAPGRQDLASPAPGGDRIAFVDMSADERSILILSMATGRAVSWKQGPGLSWPCWSPDGKLIA